MIEKLAIGLAASVLLAAAAFALWVGGQFMAAESAYHYESSTGTLEE